MLHVLALIIIQKYAKELFSYWVEEHVMFNTKVALYEAIVKVSQQ